MSHARKQERVNFISLDEVEINIYYHPPVVRCCVVIGCEGKKECCFVLKVRIVSVAYYSTQTWLDKTVDVHEYKIKLVLGINRISATFNTQLPLSIWR